MMSRLALYLKPDLFKRARTWSACLFSTICGALALSGCALMISALLWQVYEILSWGVTYDWHYHDSLGWGCRWVLNVELHGLALLLASPFWIFFRNQDYTVSVQSRSAIKLTVLPVLAIFMLLSVLEIYLQKAFP